MGTVKGYKMADNTQKVIRNYPGNYTVLARGAASTPSNTYEVERCEIDHGWRSQIGSSVRWNVRAFDEESAHDSFDTLRDAKAEIEFWAEGDDAAKGEENGN